MTQGLGGGEGSFGGKKLPQGETEGPGRPKGERGGVNKDAGTRERKTEGNQIPFHKMEGLQKVHRWGSAEKK